ncbi:MAG: CPBP family intramembrane metalloprotease [Ruminiclostridium sp.]|nr:CPBP family intramembrane metalloprotease [Ruminiclostridium sp.]
MSSDKKTTVKRLIIFLILAFLPFYIIIPTMWAYFGEPVFASERDDAAIATYCIGVFGMMIPSAAQLITRLATKEGFKNIYLGLNCKGRMGYYAASVIVPLGYSAIAAVIIWAFLFDGMSFSDAFGNIGIQSAGLFLLQLAFSVICFFHAFGEEWGWRGYMMPKLMELMPKPAAIIVGGIIWGLWHAPLTVAGHNFGIDYPGYPFVGIGCMCILCTLMNAFLTLITEKTKSVYPAAFCHALNNNLSFGVMFAIFGSEAAIDKISEVDAIVGFLSYIWILAVVGTVSFILLMKKDKRNKQVLDKAA